MNLSIVIPTHSRPLSLIRLLRSIARQNLARLTPEVIVISDVRCLRTRIAVRMFRKAIPSLRFETGERRGVNSSRNRGLELSSRDTVLFLDDDCELNDADFLARHLRLHVEHPDALAIGGIYRCPKTASIFERAYQAIVDEWQKTDSDSATDSVSASWHLLGGNISYKKTGLGDAAVRFDENILYGGSETELNERLRSAGHLGLFTRELAVRHHCRVGLLTLIKKAIFQGLSASRRPRSTTTRTPNEISPPRELTGLARFLFELSIRSYRRGFEFGFAQGQDPSAVAGVMTARLALGYCRWVKRAFIARHRWIVGWVLARLRFWSGWLWMWTRIWASRAPHLIPSPLRFHLGTLRDRNLTRVRLLGLGWKYTSFLLSHRRLQGSVTARYLENVWRERTRYESQAAVYLPSDAKDLVTLAQTARRFRHQRMILGESFLERSDHLDVAREILRLGLEVETLIRPSLLNDAKAAAVERLRLIGCAITPYLDSEDDLVSFDVPRVAVSPSFPRTTLKSWTKNEIHSKRRAPELIYLDLLNSSEFCPATAYQNGLEIAAATKSQFPRWTFASVIHPFHRHPSSRNRYLEGEIVWRKRVDDESDPEWTIIIPCFERYEYLPLVLEHALRQDYDTSMIEIIIVDDGSSLPVHIELEAALSRLATLGNARLAVIRLDREPGDTTFRAGIARNAGLMRATGRKTLFLDADILLLPNHLARLDLELNEADVVQSVRYMVKLEASGPDVRANLIDLDRDIYPEDAYWEKFKRMRDWHLNSAPWKYVCTYALALKRETWRTVGFFRPEFCEYGFEDTEMGFRLWRAGYRFRILKSPVFHLYPIDASREMHFDAKARNGVLRRSAALFHRMHPEPSIYFELRSLLDGPAT